MSAAESYIAITRMVHRAILTAPAEEQARVTRLIIRAAMLRLAIGAPAAAASYARELAAELEGRS